VVFVGGTCGSVHVESFNRKMKTLGVRERELFIGTQFSILYTSVYPPVKGRISVCLVFVIACKCALRRSQVS